MAAWNSSGRLTNPTAGQVLVDTGVLAPGTRILNIVVASSVIAICELQQRDSTNANTVKSQAFAIPANGTVVFDVPCGIDNADQERYRIILISAITGTLSASLFA